MGTSCDKRLGILRWWGIVLMVLAGGYPLQAVDYRTVAPILERHCVGCHRAGEIGPMPLTSYAEVRPWAKAIREVVHTGRMPPWFAHRASVQFANEAKLSDEERAQVLAWVAAGAPEGERLPPRPKSEAGEIWRPDAIITAPRAFRVAPGDVVDYQYLILAAPWAAEDRWVTRVEIRPTARAIVHHVVAYLREKGDPWLANAPRGVMHVPPAPDRQTKADILAVYTPGTRGAQLPPGMAKKFPAGAELVLQFHYTAAAKAMEDRTSVVLEFAQETPRQRVLTLQMGVDDLEIAPGERRYRRSVSGTLPQDAWLLTLMPHMHLRGSEFEFEILGAQGQAEMLLHVKPFDFYWQLTYLLREPRLLRRGTRLRWTGTFDNSAANRRNPDPKAEVGWGEQSWQEMMIGFFDVAVEAGTDKRQFFVR
jgi:hypothetical protein